MDRPEGSFDAVARYTQKNSLIEIVLFLKIMFWKRLALAGRIEPCTSLMGQPHFLIQCLRTFKYSESTCQIILILFSGNKHVSCQNLTLSLGFAVLQAILDLQKRFRQVPHRLFCHPNPSIAFHQPNPAAFLDSSVLDVNSCFTLTTFVNSVRVFVGPGTMDLLRSPTRICCFRFSEMGSRQP